MTNPKAIHLLFGMEDQFGIAPAASVDCTLGSSNPTTKKALRDWSKKHAKLESGEITNEEYADRKDTYSPNTVLAVFTVEQLLNLPVYENRESFD